MTPDPRPLAVVEPERAALSVLDVIQRAIVGGADPLMLDKLIAMKERAEERAAAQAFAEAMQRFQEECRPVIKTLIDKGKAGKQRSANLEDIEDEVYPVANRHGLIITFDTEEGPVDRVNLVCHVRHGAHVEDSRVSVPIRNDLGGYAGAVTTAQRLVLRLALRISLQNAPTVPETLTAAEAMEIGDLMRERVVDETRIFEFAQADRISLIPRSKFAQIRDGLLRKPRRGK